MTTDSARWASLASGLVCLSACLPVCLLRADLSAQQSQPKVLHVWVSSQFGNDQLAQQNNPSATNHCGTTTNWPHDVLDTNQALKPLLNSPWPFKTITAALASIPPLPQPASSTSNPTVWQYAVVHVLPGVYAPGTGRHPDVGLLRNGETFPLRIPRSVSLQGASALNTLLDLEGMRDGPILLFGVTAANGEPCDGTNTFVDCLSLAGAAKQPGSSAHASRFAAVYIAAVDDIWGTVIPSHPTFTNCCFFRNDIGILVASAADAAFPAHDGVTLFNNTLAFNRFAGLWNGQIAPYPGPQRSPHS